MEATKQDLVRYRISRAYETLEDAHILAAQNRWNSAINRLYYAAYYAVIALLIQNNLYPSTHTGAKSNFNQYFVNTGLIEKLLEKYIPSYLLGGKKVTMTTCLILIKKK